MDRYRTQVREVIDRNVVADDDWHLVPHDVMVEHARIHSDMLATASWIEGGAPSTKRPSAASD